MTTGEMKPVRYGSVSGVRPEKLDEYIEMHAATWPGVLAMIQQCNIQNYSIYFGKLEDGKLYLFTYFEYVGNDFEADMRKMAADPTTQEWWKLAVPCLIPLEGLKPGEHWLTMREVFHMD
jgi:L-rhamnose mutarotase